MPTGYLCFLLLILT